MFKRSLMAALAVVVLSGCAMGPAQEAPAPIGGTVLLGVRDVLVDDVYTSPGAPNIDQMLSPTPAELLRDALSSHYFAKRGATSGAPTLRLSIVEASVVKTMLPQPEGALEKLFHPEPDVRYNGKVRIEGRLESSTLAGAIPNVAIEATRQLELGNLSAADEKNRVDIMVRQMVNEAVVQLDKQMEATFGGLVFGGGNAMPLDNYTLMPQPSGRWDKVNNWK